MKKLLCLLLCALLLAGCAESLFCAHEYTSALRGGIFADRERLSTCTKCGHTETEVLQKATGTLKLLFIGDRQARCAVEYIRALAVSAGAEDVVVGCLWRSGANLSTHAGNIRSGRRTYHYAKCTETGWEEAEGRGILECLEEEAWDAVIINQESIQAGIWATYEDHLDEVQYIMSQRGPEGCQLWLNMPWACGEGYADPSGNFAYYYGSDPAVLHSAICEVTRDKAMPSDWFDGMMPCGTAVQNLRGRLAEERITADGIATTTLGSYTLALTVLGAMTDFDVSAAVWRPEELTAADQQLAIWAAQEALENPYRVIQ